MTTEESISRLAEFLHAPKASVTFDKVKKVPKTKTNNGLQIAGFVTVCKQLARLRNAELLGSTPEEQALVSQWLEWADVQPNGSRNIENFLETLDTNLATRAFLAGASLTVADVLLFYTIHNIMAHMWILTSDKKHLYPNLRRWFDQVQHTKGVKQDLATVQPARYLALKPVRH